MRKLLLALSFFIINVFIGFPQLHSSNPFKLAGYEIITDGLEKKCISDNKIKSVICDDFIYDKKGTLKEIHQNFSIKFNEFSDPIILRFQDEEWFDNKSYVSNITYTYYYDSYQRINHLEDIQFARKDTNKRDIFFTFDKSDKISFIENKYTNKEVVNYQELIPEYYETKYSSSSKLVYDSNNQVILLVNISPESPVFSSLNESSYPNKPYDSLLVSTWPNYDVIINDSNGNIMERIYYISQSKVHDLQGPMPPPQSSYKPVYKKQWKYNDKNQPIEITTISNKNKIINNTYIKYNEEGLVIEKIYTFEKEKKVSKYIYEYFE